ncbi:MAG TPA: hypothetical protein VN908_09410 [Gemmatimonadales bacterium]|nr:hypothetical protein [Gemmatimonadales bacterium]
MTPRDVLLACVCLVAAAAAACNNSTGPQNLAGTYNYTVPNLNGTGVGCSVNVTMMLTQQSATLGGTYTGTRTCSSSAGNKTDPISGAVVNAQINRDSVYFDFDSSAWHNAGVIVGTGLQGSVTARISPFGTATDVAGDFTAIRQ